jgi:hypothetical protein
MKHQGHLKRIEYLLGRRRTHSHVNELREILLEELHSTARYGHSINQARLIAAVERYDRGSSKKR